MKQRLDNQTIAMRAAKELNDGDVVNLGFGIPTLATIHIPEGKTIIWHQENGVIGHGPVLSEDELDRGDYDLVDNTGHFLNPAPGMCLVDAVESFTMVRGGHLDATILGALQVSERGDLANWMTTMDGAPGIGGAMDMAAGAKRVIIVMHHTSKNGESKIMKRCTYPITAVECVDLIITDLAVIEVREKRLILKETSPGWSVEEIQALTEATLMPAEDLKEIEL